MWQRFIILSPDLSEGQQNQQGDSIVVRVNITILVRPLCNFLLTSYKYPPINTTYSNNFA